MELTEENLEKVVIKLSVGYGLNMPEAAQASIKAKEERKKGLIYNIVRYDGKPIVEKELSKEKAKAVALLGVEEFLQGLTNFEDGYINPEYSRLFNSASLRHLKTIASLSKDPQTDLLNRTGYRAEVERLIRDDQYSNRVIIFMDGDNMHDINAALGYSNTDMYLNAIGQALNSQIRKKERRNFVEKTCQDEIDKRHIERRESEFNKDKILNLALAHRVNDSGGDEFILDVECEYDDAPAIAKRCIDTIYQAQIQLTDQQLKEGTLTLDQLHAINYSQ